MVTKAEVEFGSDWMNINGWTISVSWVDCEFCCSKDGVDSKYFYNLVDAVKHCKEN